MGLATDYSAGSKSQMFSALRQYSTTDVSLEAGRCTVTAAHAFGVRFSQSHRLRVFTATGCAGWWAFQMCTISTRSSGSMLHTGCRHSNLLNQIRELRATPLYRGIGFYFLPVACYYFLRPIVLISYLLTRSPTLAIGLLSLSRCSCHHCKWPPFNTDGHLGTLSYFRRNSFQLLHIPICPY